MFSRYGSYPGSLLLLVGSCGYIDNPLYVEDEATGSGGSESGESSASTTLSGTLPTSSSSSGPTTSTDSSESPTTTSSTSGEMGCAPGSLDCACIEGLCDEGLTCDQGICADLPICGDGIVEGQEVCDDGNAEGADGCDTDCTPTRLDTVVAGNWHTCLLTLAGEVLCFGRNEFGQLGYAHTSDVGDNEDPDSWHAVSLPEPATAIAAGGSHTCALLLSGTALCWGNNDAGQLGQGNTDPIGDDEHPTEGSPIDLGAEIDELAVGEAFTCAKTTTNDVYCWGQNGSGQLGHGDTADIGDNEPVTPANSLVQISSASTIAAGQSHACAALMEEGLRCWGSGLYGQLGYGSSVNIGDNELPANLPKVLPQGDFAALALGAHHTLALNASELVRGFGSNAQGQLGTGVSTNYGDGMGPADATVPLLASASAVAAGRFHSCAISSEGTVSCWGLGGSGQLGYGVTTTIGDNESVAGQVPLDFGANAIDIAAGEDHSCALLENGELYCWGTNPYGQIGHPNVLNVGIDQRADTFVPVPLFE